MLSHAYRDLSVVFDSFSTLALMSLYWLILICQCTPTFFYFWKNVNHFYIPPICHLILIVTCALHNLYMHTSEVFFFTERK